MDVRTAPESKKCENFTQKCTHKSQKCTNKNSLLNTQINAKTIHTKKTKNAKKCTQKFKKNTKKAKPDISVLIDILPGRRRSDIGMVRNFHHFGYPRYYRDILESVTGLLFQESFLTMIMMC